MIRCLLVCICSALAGVALAQPQAAVPPDSADLRQSVTRFLQMQTAGLPGLASFEVGQADARLALAPCAQHEAFLPPGTRAWGRINVGVRCVAGASWSIYLPARVRVEGDYLVAARALGRGQIIAEGDYGFMRGELTELPPNMITDPQHAIGQTVNGAIGAGQPLRADWLRAPVAVQQGQVVKLFARGNGFAVSHDGRALANAQSGQMVQVRTGQGQVVSGVARAGGQVEVVY
jgi:flagellar basal body P-ring formation protein FlgA